jgi:hypothetical protein
MPPCVKVMGARRQGPSFQAPHQVGPGLLGCRFFRLKVTPKGRRVFLVPHSIGGTSSKLPTCATPYGAGHASVSVAAQVLAAKLEGRDPAAEKRETKRRIVEFCGRRWTMNVYNSPQLHLAC